MDIVTLRQSLAMRKQYIRWYDSLVLLLGQNNDNNLNDINFYARHVGRTTEFNYHDGTILQLKNSGGGLAHRSFHVSQNLNCSELN